MRRDSRASSVSPHYQVPYQVAGKCLIPTIKSQSSSMPHDCKAVRTTQIVWLWRWPDARLPATPQKHPSCWLTRIELHSAWMATAYGATMRVWCVWVRKQSGTQKVKYSWWVHINPYWGLAPTVTHSTSPHGAAPGQTGRQMYTPQWQPH